MGKPRGDVLQLLFERLQIKNPKTTVATICFVQSK